MFTAEKLNYSENLQHFIPYFQYFVSLLSINTELKYEYKAPVYSGLYLWFNPAVESLVSLQIFNCASLYSLDRSTNRTKTQIYRLIGLICFIVIN